MKRKLIVMSKDEKSKVEYDMETVRGVWLGTVANEFGEAYCTVKGLKEAAVSVRIEFKNKPGIRFEDAEWKVMVIEEKEPEEAKSTERGLKLIWQQVEEKAVEKIEKIMMAIENRDKSAMDKATEEYNKFLNKLSEILEMEEKELDDRFASLWWSRQRKNG